MYRAKYLQVFVHRDRGTVDQDVKGKISFSGSR